MWTLFIVVPGLSWPIVIHGYTSKRWAEEQGQEAVTSLRGGHFWATKMPLDNSTPESEIPDGA